MTRNEDATAVPPPSGTVTFLFSDIEGSTQRWARDRTAMQNALRLHDRLMHEAVTENGGHVFKTMGDAFCVAFATPESAASAALDAQRALGAADFFAVGGLRVRMAINTGTADERDGDYFGPALNRVARLLALGHGGQVLLSKMSAELVRENAPREASLDDLGEHVLKDHEGRERVFQLVAPDLQREFPELRSQQALRPWLVPDAMRTRYFTGRDDLLKRVREQLVERHRAVLSGLGGAGKTQTAIEYAVRNRTAYPNGVLWVNAETITGLTSGFAAIGKTLGLAAAESNDQEAAVKAVLEWLNRSEGWLLVLDNVHDRAEAHAFVPRGDKGDLLITSRESVFPEWGIPRGLIVEDLEREESVRFLFARTGRADADSGDRDAASELAAELGDLPLALEQAAAYVTETNAAFSAYLGAFRKRRVALLEKAIGMVSHDTVAVTWAANFEAVEGASLAAADVLRISALLAPDAIPFELFLDGAQLLGDAVAAALADPDELSMAEVLRPLARYSLILSDPASRGFSVHRLVQQIVWAALDAAGRRSYAARAILALDAAFPNVTFETWGRCERLVSHVASIAERAESDDVQPEAAARVLNRSGRYLCERGRYAEAQALIQRALAICERTLGPDHPDVAQCLNDLAVAHWHRGRYDDAQALHERALAIRERAHGPDHTDVARSLNNLAVMHWEHGRYAEAQALWERSLGILQRALGPDHPAAGHILNNLGVLAYKQGRYGEAEALHERAVAIREGALGPDHPDVAHSVDGLAGVYAYLGRYAEAEPLYERALAIWERTLGPDHPNVAQSLYGLGSVYHEQGRYAEAEACHGRALSIRERALGREHPFLAFSLGGLAAIHAHFGRYAEAERLYERALRIRESALGPEHIEVAETLMGLASLRREQGRNADAIVLYERALAVKARAFAAGHPELDELRTTLDALRSSKEKPNL